MRYKSLPLLAWNSLYVAHCNYYLGNLIVEEIPCKVNNW
jgi:hypothetical protein